MFTNKCKNTVSAKFCNNIEYDGILISSVGIDETSTMTSSIIVAWTGSVCVLVGVRKEARDIIPDDIGRYSQDSKLSYMPTVINQTICNLDRLFCVLVGLFAIPIAF